MQAVDNLMMLSMAVNDMHKAKGFYADKLGLKVVSDYNQGGENRWVSLEFSDGTTITLTTFHENMKPGTMKLYFATSNITNAHKELTGKGVDLNDVKDDLYGPDSGVKWFDLEDPDGNQVLFVQA